MLFTTRIPTELFFELKKRALRSTIQLLAEHAYTLYLGTRLPPELWGGFDWPEEFPAEPRPVYLTGEPRQFSVRIPRRLHRRIRCWAVEASLSDQELAAKVFDWYIRKKLLPPYRNREERDETGRLLVDRPLIADRFVGYSSKEVMDALEIMIEAHTKYGGPLAPARSDLGRARRQRA